LEDQVLKDHVAHCVEAAILGGDQADQRQKAEELLALIANMDP
jgi:DNA-binding FrmR family transcriptional regulator